MQGALRFTDANVIVAELQTRWGVSSVSLGATCATSHKFFGQCTELHANRNSELTYLL